MVAEPVDKTLILGMPAGMVQVSQQNPHYRWLQQALAVHGYRFELRQVPAKRLLQQVDQGALDGDISRVPSVVVPYRHLVQVVTPFLVSCYAGYGVDPPAAEPDQGRRPELLLRVGLVRGSEWIQQRASQRWPEESLLSLNDYPQGLKQLMAGRLDLLLMPEQLLATRQIRRLQETRGISLLRQTDWMAAFESYIYLHERHRNLAVKLAEALTATKPDFVSADCH